MNTLNTVIVAAVIVVAAYATQDIWAPRVNSLLGKVPVLPSVREKVNGLGASGY